MMTPARKEPDKSTYAGRFAARLKELRIKAKLTPEQVADALGVHVQTVYKWESGTRSPIVAGFSEIAEALKLKKVKDLFPNE